MSDIRWGPFTDHEKALALDVLRRFGGTEHWRIEWREPDPTIIDGVRFGAHGLCSYPRQVVMVDEPPMFPTESIFQVLLHEIGHAYDAYLRGWIADTPSGESKPFYSDLTLDEATAQRDLNLSHHANPADFETMPDGEFMQIIDELRDIGSSESIAEMLMAIFRRWSWQTAPGDNPTIAARLQALARYPMPTGATQNDTR